MDVIVNWQTIYNNGPLEKCAGEAAKNFSLGLVSFIYDQALHIVLFEDGG
jgi:hypothetical protein